MYNAKIRKSKRILTLFMIITTVFVLNFIPFNLNSQDLLTETDSPDEIQFLDELEIADYSQSYSSNGDNFDITLHQSYLNNSYNLMLNASDTNNNTFSIPCPTDTTFNSSYTKFEIDNIYAPNKSLVIEESTPGFTVINANHYTSFRVPTSCYITNLSVNLYSPSGADIFSFDIYGALDDSGIPKFDLTKDLTGLGPDLGSHTNDSSSGVWFTLTGFDQFLNVSETYDNYFFIKMSTSVGWGRWSTEYEGNGDDTYSYDSSSHIVGADFTLKVGLRSIGNNIANASDINLKINNADVTDITDGQGYWESNAVNGSVSGILKYNVTADWWDVTSNIKEAQINYTKTDIQAISNFDILGSGEEVNWTVSVPGGLNYFDDQLTEFNTINFSIPSTWDPPTIQVFNGSLEIPGSSINTDFVSFPFREVQVLHATNGSNWYLTANSTNLLSSITVEGVTDYTAKFSEVVRFNATFVENVSEGILNLTVYSPAPRYQNHSKPLDLFPLPDDNVFTVSDWDISTEAQEYGIYLNQMFWNNGTAAGMIESYLTIIGDTSIDVLDPPENSIYKVGEFIDIIVEYNDTRFSQAVPETEAIINYSLNEGADYLYENITYLGDGRHNISINVNHPHFSDEFGFVDVLINCSGRFYENKTIEFEFHRQITTVIAPSNTATLGPIIRGQNVSYMFSYSDTLANPIIEANWSVIGSDEGFQSFLQNHNDGTYTIHLDSDNVNVAGSPFTFKFNISAIGNETQEITLTINVNIIGTEIINTTYFDQVSRSSGLNQTFTFYFNDTTNDEPVKNINTIDVLVKDNSTGIVWDATDFDWIVSNGTGDGNYILNISLKDIDSGSYTLEVNVSKAPNYNFSLSYFSFYLRGNYSQTNLVSVSDPGGLLTSVGNYNFTIFEGSDITVEFNMTDLEYGNTLISSLADSYTVRYQNLNTPANGIIASSFQIVALNHRGSFTTSNPALVIGNYEINVTINKLNYEDVSFVLNLTVIQKYQANLTTIRPESVNAGLPFKVVIKAEYYDGSDWLLIEDSYITIIPYYNGIAGTSLGPYLTNSTGEVEFEIPTYSDTKTLNLTIHLTTAFYHQAHSIEILDITVIPSAGFSFEDLLPYLILIGAAVAVVAGSVAIHRGVVVPKKREKTRILTEVKTIFDDAINLEHVLVLYKGTGTCVFFKSFGSEQIDPELISGFISAISSFGKDLVSQEELNEISYGDKMLLLSDGEFIRVALVLGKKASLILRRNLMEFIHSFERDYANDLPKWRGQLNIFRDAGSIIDEILSTSIILPHEITYEHSKAKALKKAQSRDVLKIANNLMKDSERNFFFIATLLKEATEKTGKDTAEIFMGIKELRDIKILMPIEISTIEAKPISQQEINLINQKVSSLVNLSPEERQKLVNDLAQIGPAEREAYFVSLAKQHEIISAPIESKPGAAVIETIKQAKKEIKSLNKNAMVAKKEKDYDKCMKILQNAVKLALNWELVKESQELDDTMRKTKIEDFTIKMKILEKEAKLAVKGEKYNEAAQKYKISSKIASEIFKLGVTDMTKEVKRLSNKAKEYEKLV